MTKASLGLIISDLNAIAAINLPEIVISSKTEKFHKHWLAWGKGIREATVIDSEQVEGNVSSLKIRLTSGEVISIASRERKFAQGEALLIADSWQISAGVLRAIGGTRWISIPITIPQISKTLQDQIKKSWRNALHLTTNLEEDDGTGLRRPQIGALHALAAHWSTKSSPGIIVLPTGTGKTDVMIAALVIKAPLRLLVLLPSDALRTQLSEKFVRLGVLRITSSVPETALNPIVAVIRKRLTEQDFSELKDCNVVVTTVSMLRNMQPPLLSIFLDQFTTVFVDEAHHVPADSWKKVYEAASKTNFIGFTATPFREDGRRIPGPIIYNFPLRIAQKLKYFTPITFLDINEPDLTKVAFRLAEAGVEKLREDEAQGFRHILLARAGTQSHAEKLFNEIYLPRYSDLNPVLLHSGISRRKEIVERIRSGFHRIIICVDMLGEGFDLPELKISVLHTVHKSLAITLQFVGRFTRTASHIGNATILGNSADDRFPLAIEELYAEDADWNELLPNLSQSAIGNEIALREFIENMRPSDLPDASLFDLISLKPKMSAVMFKAPSFNSDLVDKAVPSGYQMHAKWVSDDRQLAVCITRSRRELDWADVKGAVDEVWDLWIFAYDESLKVLFINSSLRSSLHGEVARRVTSNAAVTINGEDMFRAFSGISRLTLHNVGLYGKGKLRFKMFAGLDITDAVTAVHQANNAKSNLFATGYQEGMRIGIGVSFKGRVWAMESGTIPAWFDWCRNVVQKILDTQIQTNAFLTHTLLPKQIDRLPNLAMVAVLTPDEWLPGGDNVPHMLLDGATRRVPLSDAYVAGFLLNDQVLRVDLAIDDAVLLSIFLRWGPTEGQLAISLGGTPPALRLGGRDLQWAEYLKEEPFTILFVDGSELRGSIYLSKNSLDLINFDSTHAQAIDWLDTDITVESKWKSDVVRTKSIQAFMIGRLIVADNIVVFDDDGANEAADIVTMSVDDEFLICTLYHCKYSSNTDPGQRVKDVQEVCAQAVRSARWSDNPASLIKHLRYREGDGRRGSRPTRFERGTVVDLKRFQNLIKRRRFKLQICIVQPGLSLSTLDSQRSSVLGAADNYITELTGNPLRVFASG